MKITMVTTFRVPCGVAAYTQELCYSLNKLCNLKIYAETVQPGSREDTPMFPEEKPLQYTRNWSRTENFDQLYNDIIDDIPDVVHIQFESTLYNESMFNQSYFTPFLQKLKRAEISVVMTLHNVLAFNASLPYTGWYKKTGAYFIVTNDLMKKELSKWEPTVKSKTIPLGSTIFQPTETVEARKQLGLPLDKFLITQTGFLGQDKGILPLIESLPKILKTIPNAMLVFAGSIHPLAPQCHKDYVKKCIITALNLKMERYIILTGRFLSEEDLSLYLSAADIIMVNHQYVFSLYSSSASAHRALACGKPLIMNADDVRLSEFVDIENCLKAKNYQIPTAVVELYNNPGLRENLIYNANKYALKTSYKEIAKEHIEVYKNAKNK